MNSDPRRVVVTALALLVWMAAPRSAGAGPLGNGSCRISTQPAATLLIPYFESDYNDPGHTTLIAVTNINGLTKGHIVRVVLWTDYGIPTLAFDVFLGPTDIQTLNLTDLLAGKLPQTGTLDQVGAFAHCSASLRPPGGTAVQASIDRLRARHIGHADPGSSQCAGADHGDSVARGYITVDATDQCMPVSPSLGEGSPAKYTPGYSSYYAAGNANDLTGDFLYLNNGANQAEGTEAVHVVSDTDRFVNDGAMTFYGRYAISSGQQLGGLDHRAPLSDLYFSRYLNGGVFSGGTSLVVWREVPGTQPQTVPCTGRPSWYPLGQSAISAVDEDDHQQTIYGNTGAAFPLATQKVAVAALGGAPLPASFGGLMLNLRTPDHHAQAFVLPVLSAQDRFSLGFNATRVNDLCGVHP